MCSTFYLPIVQQSKAHRERRVYTTVCADVQFTEVHVIGRGKLYDDVSGRRGVTTLQVDRRTCSNSARILTTHGVVEQNGRLFLC